MRLRKFEIFKVDTNRHPMLVHSYHKRKGTLHILQNERNSHENHDAVSLLDFNGAIMVQQPQVLRARLRRIPTPHHVKDFTKQ